MKASIENIKRKIDLLEVNIIDFRSREKDIRNMDDIVYWEDTLKDVIDDINIILKQINYLLKSHNLFSRISTLAERNNLNSYFSNLNSYITNSNFTHISQTIDAIKSILRNYNTFIFTKKDYISELYEELIKLKQSEWEARELLEKIFKIFEEKEKVIEKLEKLEDNYDDLENKLNLAEEKKNEIINFHSEAKSHKEIIDNFSNEVNSRNKQLEEQEQKTKDFENKLNNFTKKQWEFTIEAEKLINSAKKALKYKTAEWISASIQAQYDEAKKWTTAGWLWLSLLFISMTIWLGIWLLVWNLDITMIIWRIVLLPITIAWAIFTANQYVKQKNLIEDYAYKLVLTKSIVGFSEELLKVEQTNEWYQKYITKVLDELLQYPLRGKNKWERNKIISSKELKEWLSIIKDVKDTVN